MTNGQIAEIFNEIASRLELEGDNPFRVRAYKRAAEAIFRLSEPLDKMARDGRIQSIPGIGKDLEQKILDLLSTGTLRESPEKYPTAPAGPGEEIPLFLIPGLDPKIIRLLRRRFRMETREDLESLARSRLLRTVPELGHRIEKIILKALGKTAVPENDQKGSGPGSP